MSVAQSKRLEGIRLRYAGGFFLGPEYQGTPDHWFEYRIGGYRIWIDPLVPVGQSCQGGAEVFVAGNPLDCNEHTATPSAIARSLVACLVQSEVRLDEHLYFVGGRYIVLYGAGSEVTIRADAVGSRSIFYSRRHPGIVASHAALLAGAIGAGRQVHEFTRLPAFKRGVCYYPGCITPYDNVVFLTPNTRLELNSLRVERYFPAQDLRSRSTQKAARLAADAMTAMVRLAASCGGAVQSLTAGLDSRVSLACSAPVRDRIRYFTYTRSKTHSQEVDAAVASALADHYGLNHTVIDRDAHEPQVDSNELEQMRWNTFLGNASRLSLCYRDVLPGASVHIRSNMGEIGRSVYTAIHGTISDFTPEAMARIWKRGLEGDADVIKAFDEFWRVARFDGLRNYEPMDLFYWEHRMGVWHSLALNESDVAFPTVSAFNAHFILDYLLSAPLKDRVSGRLYQKIIRLTWPELASWPINEPLPEDRKEGGLFSRVAARFGRT